MDKERFTHFRAEFVHFVELIKKGNDIDVVLADFLRGYPELTAEFELPDLVKVSVPDIVIEEGSTIEEESPTVKKRNRRQKNMEDIKRRLMESVKEQKPWKDYTDTELNIDNEESCLKALKTLDEAEADARKRIIYLSCLKGQVFQRLREISGKKMSQLLKLTDYSQAHAYFLIKLYNLALEYNKLMYSNLPIRFFSINWQEIVSICKSNEIYFK